MLLHFYLYYKLINILWLYLIKKKKLSKTMVYAFFVGLTVGLPVGCYLREVGYAKKLKDAYYIFAAAPDTHTSDKFKSKSD